MTTDTNVPVPAGTEHPRLSKATLEKSFWRSFWSFQISWNYERMQGLGFGYAIEPALKEIYTDKDEYSKALTRHLSFFNTNPVLGAPLILGSAVALEEARAPASADGIKVGLMGPLAGVGDTLLWGLYNTIIFTLGANWALQGSLFGPIFVMLMVLIPYFLARRWQFFWAYKRGHAIAADFSSGVLDRITEGATIFGLIVLGGFIPSIIRLYTSLEITQRATVDGQEVETVTPVQTLLDQVVPYLLPLLLVALCYILLKKFKLNPVWVIAIVFALGLIFGGLIPALDWFTPAAPVAAAAAG